MAFVFFLYCSMKPNKLIYTLLLFLLIYSCDNNSTTEDVLPDEEQQDNTDDGPDNNDDPDQDNGNAPTYEKAGEVEILNSDLIDQNPVLINDAGNNLVYLMNKKGEIIFDWNINNGNLGNDCFIESNGKLLAMLESEETLIALGGQGGKIELLDKEGNVEWQFTYSSEDYILHHDAERMPNGNVLLMVWEKLSASNAIAIGYKQEIDIYPDAIIEVDPTNNEIVWEWHMWDHLVQDYDENLPYYGSISENPHLIDINYNQLENGDVSHANGIEYDATNDIIYLSVNFYHEIWAIDHSTTTEEASSHEGGNYNVGGDLIYRFGNPEAYGDFESKRMFNNNHHPNLIEDNTMFVFGNGSDQLQSTVFEIEIPETFKNQNNEFNEPSILWSFTDPELFSPKVSGAVTLPNGNILITEGDFGAWEVTRDKEVVWKFSGDGFYWRTYSYTENELISNDILNPN